SRGGSRSHRKGSRRRQRRGVLRGLEVLEGRLLLAISLVKDINSVELYPSNIINANGTAFYLTKDSFGNGIDLVATSASGTTVLRDFPQSPTSGMPTNLTAAGSRLYFSAQADDGSTDIWVSDGTVAGTTRIVNVPSGDFLSQSKPLGALGSSLY